MSVVKKEIKIFFTALMFYTRIPCPPWVDHSEEFLNKATRYFPLIGWIVGLSVAVIFYGSVQVLPISISVILSMLASIWITGAFHEDGWADVCDGFGGGWTKQKILEIMKDSVVGAYGVVGIVMILLLKSFLLYEIALMTGFFTWGLVALGAHSMSRLMSVATIYSHNYARDNEDSKAKPVAKKLSLINLLIASLFAAIPLLLFDNYWVLVLIAPLLITKAYMAYYFHKWIEGYTGDCLGAIQQVSEIVFYLSFLMLWKFI